MGERRHTHTERRASGSQAQIHAEVSQEGQCDQEEVGVKLGRGPDGQSHAYYRIGRRREAGVPGRACLWDCENLVLIRRH